MTITADQELFGYWFQLQAKAAERGWDVLRDLLAKNPDRPLPRHNLNDLSFKAAAENGQFDIIETFFGRGYVPEEKILTDLLAELAIAMRAGKVLAKDGRECARRWLAALPAEERAATLDAVLTRILKNDENFERIFILLVPAACDGFDPWRGGDILTLVAGEGAHKKLTAMFMAGLDPYAPGVMETFAKLGGDKNATASQRALIGIWMNFCNRHPVTDPAMARFADMKMKQGPWQAADFLTPLTPSATPRLIDVIVVRGGHQTLKEVFDQMRWQGRFAEMQQVYDVAMTRTSLAPADMAVLRAQFAQTSLRERPRPRVSFSGPKADKLKSNKP